MRPKTFDIDPANVNTTGYGTGFTGAGPHTMTTTNSGDGLAHQVGVGSTSDINTIVFTLTGTDADGRAQTDTVTGINNNVVESTKYFKTLTTIASDATIGGATIDVGWVDEVASQTIPLDFYLPLPPTIDADLTGTANFDIQISTRNPLESGIVDQEDLAFIDDANWTGKSADYLDDLSLPGLRAMRFVTNSYSSGAEIQFYCTFPRHS
jgi:hypothetical protein